MDEEEEYNHYAPGSPDQDEIEAERRYQEE